MPTTVEGFQGLEQLIESYQQRLQNTNWTPLLRSMSKYLEVQHGQYFQQQAGPDGNGWAQLSAATVRRKGYSIILIEKDDLENSLTQSSYPDAIRDIYNEGAWAGLTFGTARPYSMFLQRGTSRMPARIHVGANQPIVEDLKKQTRDFAIGTIINGNLTT